MQTRTGPQEPDAAVDGGIIETEVETVRTRQHLGMAVDDIPTTDAVVIEGGSRYLDRDRAKAVGLVVRTAVEALLGIRFLLHASGANTNSAFFGFIDEVSWPFAGPFASVFSNRSSGPGSIEVSTLVAMGVYFLIFALLAMLITALDPRLGAVRMRRGEARVLAATPPSPPSPSAADGNRRRAHQFGATGVARRHRRLFGGARPREA